MKSVRFSPKFEKAYAKRILPNPKLKKAYAARYRLFCNGVRQHPVRDHALTRKMKGLRAFSITGDVRVIYRETATAYEFLDIGTHRQVYR